MKKRFLIFSLLIVLISPELTPTAAQDSSWRVKSPVSLSETLAGFNTLPHLIYIAPDGRHVAYGVKDDNAVCSVDIPTRQESCVALPPELRYAFPLEDIFPAMRWSTDSTKIALVGVPYKYFYDADLGLADFSGPVPTFTNLADDGVVGGMHPGSFDPAMTLEVNPAFSPDSTQIAVEQTGVIPERQFAQSTVSIFDLATGEVRDLSMLPGNKIYQVDAGSVLSIDWSPDGTTLAVALRHVQIEPLYDGIWLVDIASGQWTRQVTPAGALAAMQTIYPGIDDIFAATPVRWSPDGSRLLFWAGNPSAMNSRPWVFWLDLESGYVTPIELPAHPNDPSNFRLIWPYQAVWSPDGSQLLVAARLETPPEPEEAMPLVETDGALGMALYLIDISSGDLTLLGHLPLELAPIYVAAWGPDGDVIAGGFSFKLVHE